MLAEHRVAGSTGASSKVGDSTPNIGAIVDVNDINLILKEKWGISVPGLASKVRQRWHWKLCR